MEAQALATFNQAAQEMRFFKGQQWHVTNYTLAAYAALVAVASLAWPDSLRSWASWGGFGLVTFTFFWALRLLAYYEKTVNNEREILKAALNHLPLMRGIYKLHPRKGRSVMHWPRKWGRAIVKPVLGVAVAVGWLVASLVILSRDPYVQRLVASVSQLASGPWPSS